MAAAAATAAASTTTTVRRSPYLSYPYAHTSSPSLRFHLRLSPSSPSLSLRHHRPPILAFRRSDFDNFTKWMSSEKTWRDAWRSANDGMERFVFESRKAAERLDRRYQLSVKIADAARSAKERAREFDREFSVTQKWRTVAIDFKRNFPRYRKQLNHFFATPIGKGFTTMFFLWFALSGWMFRILILATWVLPLATPFLIGAVANSLVVKGACPSCKREFIGYKSQIIQCPGCGNIVWQPNGESFGKGTKGGSKSKSKPDVIDVEYEER